MSAPIPIPPSNRPIEDAYCAGFMVFRVVEQKQIEYLLLKASDLKNHWTPPKGHINPGETEFDAAIREVREESGLVQDQYEVIPGFCTHVHYEARKSLKHVTYWPAKLLDPKTQVQLSEEHVEFRWVDLKTLEEICTRESTTNAYRRVEVFLRGLLF